MACKAAGSSGASPHAGSRLAGGGAAGAGPAALGVLRGVGLGRGVAYQEAHVLEAHLGQRLAVGRLAARAVGWRRRLSGGSCWARSQLAPCRYSLRLLPVRRLSRGQAGGALGVEEEWWMDGW